MNVFIFIDDDDLLEKYNAICGIDTSDIKKGFNSEPVYNNLFLKTKIKSYGDKATNFPDKEMTKIGSSHTCLKVISIDSAFKKEKKLLSTTFLKECTYIEKEVTS